MMNTPYSRLEFDERRAGGKRIVRRHSRVAAVVSVALGLASLWLLQVTENMVSRPAQIGIAFGTFSLFTIVVGWLLLRMKRGAREVAILCPQCRAPLIGDSERIASATGKCDRCGGVVISTEPPA